MSDVIDIDAGRFTGHSVRHIFASSHAWSKNAKSIIVVVNYSPPSLHFEVEARGATARYETVEEAVTAYNAAQKGGTI